MSRINPICRVCSIALNDENWKRSNQSQNQYICKPCDNIRIRAWQHANPDKFKAISVKYRRKKGAQLYNENPKCALFLGIHIAERVLRHVFKDVEVMPPTNPGYDVICNHGKLIDIKSSCLHKNSRGNGWSWGFRINRNTIPDYFLCLAFDNREDLTPLHIWLIPGDKINHLAGATICQATLSKWDAYRLDVSKVTSCCNTLRNQSATTTESPSLKSPAGIHARTSSR